MLLVFLRERVDQLRSQRQGRNSSVFQVARLLRRQTCYPQFPKIVLFVKKSKTRAVIKTHANIYCQSKLSSANSTKQQSPWGREECLTPAGFIPR
jgi:hypothetical protein